MSHATALPSLNDGGLTPAQLAAVSFLARYTGATHQLYTYHLREWFAWCDAQSLDPLTGPTRGHVELYVRWRMTERGNCAATIGSVMAAVKGYYRFAHIDGLITHNPAEYARVPKAQYDESKTLGLDRLELSAFLAHAKVISPQHHALGYLLGILGLRVSEACAIQIADFSETERGYRVLRLVGKGGKPATMPITVPVLRAMDDAKSDRTSGPLLLRKKDGLQLDRGTAACMVETIRRRAGIEKHITPHSLRHSAITNALDAGVPLRDVQYLARHADPRTTMRYDRARGNLDRHAVHVLTAFVAGGA